MYHGPINVVISAGLHRSSGVHCSPPALRFLDSDAYNLSNHYITWCVSFESGLSSYIFFFDSLALLALSARVWEIFYLLCTWPDNGLLLTKIEYVIVGCVSQGRCTLFWVVCS